MRGRLEEPLTRRTVVKGLGGGALAVGVGLTWREISSEQTERSGQAQSHLQSACEYLDRNYDRFRDKDLSSFAGVYGLNIDAISQNLVEARRERDSARDLDGLLALERDLQTALDELLVYIETQELMLGMFAVSGTVEGDALHDDRISEAVERIIQRQGISAPSDSTAPPGYSTPFDSARYENDLSSIRTVHGPITEDLSHSVSDLVTIARDGLEVLRGLDLLHTQLIVHLEIPLLDQAVLEIDHHLSQERYRRSIEQTAGFQERFERAVADLAWYSNRIDTEASLPNEFEDVSIGNWSLLASDIEQSATAFQNAASVFERSVGEWQTGNHEKSNELWSEGLTAISEAGQQSPF